MDTHTRAFMSLFLSVFVCEYVYVCFGVCQCLCFWVFVSSRSFVYVCVYVSI